MSGKRKPVVECKDTSSSGSEEEFPPIAPVDATDSSARKTGESNYLNKTGLATHTPETTFSTNQLKGINSALTCSGSKGKKKKALGAGASFINVSKCAHPVLCTLEHAHDSTCKYHQGKCRVKKEPLPMKLRALPQSFWQQPNATIDISPGQMYAKLPPLLNKDVSDDITRSYPMSSETKNDLKTQTQVKSSLRVNDTDWIFQLFDVLDQNPKVNIGKRGRPKKVLPVRTSPSLKTEDPVLGTAVTVNPVSPSSERYLTSHSTTFTMISLKDKDKSVSLPALNIEKNYSQILSEVVVKL